MYVCAHMKGAMNSVKGIKPCFFSPSYFFACVARIHECENIRSQFVIYKEVGFPQNAGKSKEKKNKL